MSGPKCITVTPMPLCAARASNRQFCSRMLAEYERIFQDLRSATKQLNELGMAFQSPCKSAEQIKTQIERFFSGDGLEATTVCLAEKQKLEASLEAARSLLTQAIQALQQRVRQLAGVREQIPKERVQLVSWVQTILPPEWTDEMRDRIRGMLAQRLERVVNPEAPVLELTSAGVKNLQSAESVGAASLHALTEAREDLEKEINRIHGDSLTQKLSKGRAAPQKLAEFLKSLPVEEKPADQEGERFAQKVERLCAQMAVLQDTGGWGELIRRVEEIRSETDKTRRRVLYESLVLEGDGRIRNIKETWRWREEVARLLDGAAHVAGSSAESLLEELRGLARAGRVVDLKPFEARLKDAVSKEEKRLERGQKRRALLESLQELDYEIKEGMETAFVEAGKIILQKGGDDEYAVEMVVNEDLSTLQTTMLRYADSAEPSEQQRLRDIEREDAWCADHANLRQKLAARGLETQFKLKIPSGQHPVKVVVDQDRKQRRKAAASAPKVSRTQTG